MSPRRTGPPSGSTGSRTTRRRTCSSPWPGSLPRSPGRSRPGRSSRSSAFRSTAAWGSTACSRSSRCRPGSRWRPWASTRRENAALLAAEILALQHPEVLRALQAYREKWREDPGPPGRGSRVKDVSAFHRRSGRTDPHGRPRDGDRRRQRRDRQHRRRRADPGGARTEGAGDLRRYRAPPRGRGRAQPRAVRRLPAEGRGPQRRRGVPRRPSRGSPTRRRSAAGSAPRSCGCSSRRPNGSGPPSSSRDDRPRLDRERRVAPRHDQDPSQRRRYPEGFEADPRRATSGPLQGRGPGPRAAPGHLQDPAVSRSPGPGLAVRVAGPVTAERVEIAADRQRDRRGGGRPRGRGGEASAALAVPSPSCSRSVPWA